LYDYGSPRFSPDGSMIAVDIIENGSSQIWTIDIKNNIYNKLTNSGNNYVPKWSPDGKTLTFRANRDTVGGGIYTMPVDGSEQPSLLFDREGSQNPLEWSKDGEFLLYYEEASAVRDIYTYSKSDRISTPVTATDANERSPGFSPDNKWIVYVSDVSGQDEIYAKSFPITSGQTQISVDGGIEPVWSPKGNEIFYRKGNIMMKAVISTTPSLRVVRREQLFEEVFELSGLHTVYDVHPDGNSFLMVQRTALSQPSQLMVAINWLEELKRLAPRNKD